MILVGTVGGCGFTSYDPAFLPTMKILPLLFASLMPVALSAADAPADAEGYVPLFNGRDLTGWVPVNVAPDTFTARDGMVIISGQPIGYMRTEKMYENFIFECDWQHMQKGGNSGVFVW